MRVGSIRSVVLRAALVGALFARVGTAHAEGPTSSPVTPVEVRVDAPADCATPASFWAAVARRTDRLRMEPSPVAATIDVSLRREPSGVRGELRVARTGERSAVRRIQGATCGEVTDGLSLVAALAFDPDARIDRGAPAPAAAPTSASVEPPPPPPPPPAANGETPIERAPAPAPTPRDASPEIPSPSASYRFGVGAGGSVLGVGAPRAVLGYGGFVDLELDRAGLAPAFRLGVVHAEGTGEASPMSAALAWTFARGAVCPWRLDASQVVTMRPCATVDAGILSASGEGAKISRSRTRPWVAPGASARVAWAPTRLVFVEGELGVAFTLVRDELVVDPTVSLYRAPLVVPYGAVAVGVHIP